MSAKAQKIARGLARIDVPMKPSAETIPYPVRLSKAHLRVLRKNGVDIPEYLRQCVKNLAAEYEKK